MHVGVLALQGCVDPHFQHINSLGALGVKVKTTSDLESVDRIILPGGESTTMLKLLHSTDLFSALIKFGQTKPIWGICAGAILLAKKVLDPEQESLELIDIQAKRNYYGSQLDSFESEISIEPLQSEMKAQFIRAPLLTLLGDNATPIGFDDQTPVLFKQNRILAGSFHVELASDLRLHEYFLSI